MRMRTACAALLLLGSCSSPQAEPVDSASTPDLGADSQTGLDADGVVQDQAAPDSEDDVPDAQRRDPDASTEPPGSFTVYIYESCPAGEGDCYGYAFAEGRGAWVAGEEGEPTMVSGNCVFFRPKAPAYCDPPCEPGNVCDEMSGTCRPYVPPVGAGVIAVTGLKSACSIIPETQYYYYNPQFDPEPTNGDIFDEGALVTATAPGGEVPAFEISGTAVAAIQSTLACPPTLLPDQPLTVRWTPAPLGKVAFYLGSGNHGSQFSHVLCEADADEGEFVIDGALIAALLTDGVPVWRWTLSRESVTSKVIGDYRIELSIATNQGCMW